MYTNVAELLSSRELYEYEWTDIDYASQLQVLLISSSSRATMNDT